jgi:hypothetical protein
MCSNCPYISLALTSKIVLGVVIGISSRNHLAAQDRTFGRGRKGQANWHFVGDSEWMGVLKVRCAGGGRGRGEGGAPCLH